MTSRVRRSALLIPLLGLVACGSGGDGGSTGTGAAPCAEVYVEGRVVREGDLDQECTQPDGSIQVYGIATTTCSDGRTLWWNDAAWGYYGEPLHRHAPGGEQVPPRAERDRCSAP